MRKSKEIWKIYKNVFDSFTINALQKLISQKIIDGLESPVKIGKEANVFTAISGEEKRIVKIYRLESCNFNNMYSYIATDSRFQHLKRRRRDIILAWVQREYRNLLKAREAGVSVPTPYTYNSNIIIMEFIGDKEAALQLKDKSPKEPGKFMRSLVKNISDLYKKAGLVHADVSEFNILNLHEKPVLIDFAQATIKSSPNADEYLIRDVKNICRYFAKLGLKPDPEKLRKEITA